MRDFVRLFVMILCVVTAAGCATTAPEQASATEEVGTPAPNAPSEEAVDAEPKELKNTLRWTTASEVENFGFDVYRSTSEKGPFDRVTAEPLSGAGTTDEPQDYVWEDTAIEAGVDYYYYIESISYAGVRERFSPIIKSPAKH